MKSSHTHYLFSVDFFSYILLLNLFDTFFKDLTLLGMSFEKYFWFTVRI